MNRSAEEMFEQLGYKLFENNDIHKAYVHKSGQARNIIFQKRTKSIIFNANAISYEELQAINKQVEELGWNK